MEQHSYEVIITGGGAAGCMAAVTAAKRGREVLLIEKNRQIGRKLMITGKGRCNVTNNCSCEEVMRNIPCNPKFMFSSLCKFSPLDVMDFFENAGLPLKIERGNRVFPQSDDAKDVAAIFEKEMKKYGVHILRDTVTDIVVNNGVYIGVKCGKELIESESVLIATGGKSYPLTGSTGDGYCFAEKAGHTITPIKPSLSAVIAEEKYCRDMMGLSLKNIMVSLYDGEKCIFSETGEMLFTHFGLSGPVILSASSHIRDMQKNRYRFMIDLKPALDEEKLDRRIQKDFLENKNKNFINSLGKLLPSKMIGTVAKLSKIPFEQQVNSITREQRMELVKVLKGFPVTVKDFRPVEEAIVTSGGVCVKEINPATMESKLVKGLYFAGEVIDVDGYTGGFNLQIAFSTGYCAGMNI